MPNQEQRRYIATLSRQIGLWGLALSLLLNQPTATHASASDKVFDSKQSQQTCNGELFSFPPELTARPNDPYYLSNPAVSGWYDQKKSFNLPWYPSYDADYHCDNADERIYALTHEIMDRWERAGVALPAVTVYVLDSGITDHPELSESVLFDRSLDLTNGYSTVDPPDKPGDPPWLDYFGHGTFMASIIGADANNNLGIAGRTYGSETGVQMVSLKVTDSVGQTTPGLIIAGLREVLRQMEEHPDDRSVISISLSSSRPYEQAEMEALVREITKRGGIILAAAGSQGNDAPAGTPASIDGVISVGCADFDTTTQSVMPCGFSSRPEKDGVSAPGQHIYGISIIGDEEYVVRSGTSHATANAAGVVGLLLRLSPHLPSLVVREFPFAFTVPVSGTKEFPGMLNPLAALEEISRYQDAVYGKVQKDRLFLPILER